MLISVETHLSWNIVLPPPLPPLTLPLNPLPLPLPLLLPPIRLTNPKRTTEPSPRPMTLAPVDRALDVSSPAPLAIWMAPGGVVTIPVAKNSTVVSEVWARGGVGAERLDVWLGVAPPAQRNGTVPDSERT